MADGAAPAPLYVAARRVLLDALSLLAPFGDAIIVVGAQAVYLRTGEAGLGVTIAAYTTDGDLALNPALLATEPELEALMIGAGFVADQPGMWRTVTRLGDEEVTIPIDLIVPDGASTGEGRRGHASRPTANGPPDVPLAWRRCSSTTAR